MPRIKERKYQNQALAVTPWMKKKSSKEGIVNSTPSSGSSKQLMYKVVLADAHLATPSTAPGADSMQPSVNDNNRGNIPTPLQAEDTSGGWHVVSKRPRSSPSFVPSGFVAMEASSTKATAASTGRISLDVADLDRSQQPQRTAQYELQDGSQPLAQTANPAYLPYDPSGTGRLDGTGHNTELTPAYSSSPQQQDGVQLLQSSQQLHGVAQLIILPSGTISGHFVAQRSSSSGSSLNSIRPNQQQQQQQLLQPPIFLGLYGKQVLGIHSCYRDPEWALLQLSIIKYQASTKSSSSKQSCHSTQHSKGRAADPAAGAAAGVVNPLIDTEGPRKLSRHHSNSNLQKTDLDAKEQSHQVALVGGAADFGSVGGPCRIHQHPDADLQQELDRMWQGATLQEQQPQRPHDQSNTAVVGPIESVVGIPLGAATAAATTATEAAASMSADETTSDSHDDPGSPAVCASMQPAFDVRGNSSDILSETTAWVQRTGGDLVRLSAADMDDEDTAAVILQDSLGLQPDFVHVEFQADTLLAGADANQQLRQVWPELVGQQDVLVNLGCMTVCNLPADWL